MISHIPAFRQKLNSGKICLGSGVSFADPTVVEAIAPSVDFVWIDLEHCPIGVETLSAHLIAARAGGTAALVRVPNADVGWIKRVLDIGAEGIIIPQVRSAVEVRTAVQTCRYPPQGNRGYGPRRPSNYGRSGGKEYFELANREIFVAVQIETMDAVSDLDAILAVPGLDSIVIGPNDLSGSMGMLGEIQHPRVVEVIIDVIQRARAARIYAGIGMGPNADYARLARSWGVQWIQCGGDFSYMVHYVEQLFHRIRQPVASN